MLKLEANAVHSRAQNALPNNDGAICSLLSTVVGCESGAEISGACVGLGRGSGV